VRVLRVVRVVLGGLLGSETAVAVATEYGAPAAAPSGASPQTVQKPSSI